MKGVKNKIILLCFYFQKCVPTFIGYFPTLFLSFSILPFALHGLLQIANSLILSRQALRLSRHFAIGVDDQLNSGRSFVFIIFVYYCLPELSRSHSFNIEESYAEIYSPLSCSIFSPKLNIRNSYILYKKFSDRRTNDFITKHLKFRIIPLNVIN